MRALLRFAALSLTCLATPLAAQESPVVVELYTSQGCSSCPPADAMLAQLALRDDVIALALHVDYWDYIGWVDQFAHPDHTKRQQGYAHAAGETTIYTPQFVIGGTDIVIGAKGMQVADLIQVHKDSPKPIAVALHRVGDSLAISVSMVGDSAEHGPYLIQMAQLLPEESVEIRRGENAGKTISYSNIVRRLDVVDEWDGKTDFRAEAQIASDVPVAVFVQDGTDGPILAAAKLD